MSDNYTKALKQIVMKFYDSERDIETLESAINVTINHNCLNEEYHVVSTFNECIKDIVKNFCSFDKDEAIYSGWCYDRRACFKSQTPKDLPIYVKVTDNEAYLNVMSVTDREYADDKITITINLAKLKDSQIQKAVLAHEFRHALEMFDDEEKSHIGDSIYKIMADSIKNKTAYFDSALKIINLFSKSEERARIDAAIHYLKDTDIDLSNIEMSHNKIAKLVDLSKDYHMLYDMSIYLNELRQRYAIDLYDLIILIGYLWNKYVEDKIKIKITEEDVTKADNEEIAKVVYQFLLDNYETFHKNLIDAVATHLVI